MSSRSIVDSSPKRSSFALAEFETARGAFSEDGKLVYANQAFFDLTGLEESESRNLSIFDVFGFEEQDLSALEAGEHRIAIKGSPIKTELHFDWLQTADQNRYLVASALAPASDQTIKDDIEILLRRIKDSSALIKKQEDLIARPSLMETDLLEFAAMTHEIKVVTDAAGHILRCNNTFQKTFGFKPSTFSEVSLVDMFAEDERGAIHSRMKAMSLNTHEKDQPIHFESAILATNGKSRWVEWTQKYVDGSFYICGRDITDIKSKHEDLLRQQKQLSEAEAIGRMGHWHWLIGEDNISCSEEIYRIFGLNPNVFEPNINNLMEFVHKRDLGRVVQIFQRAMIEEKNYSIEFRIIRPNGQQRFVRCEGRCEKDKTDEVIALYGIMQDMTERVLYERKLNEAKNASEQAYAAKSQFLANMSHELRTPLNAIIGFSEMIEQQMLGPIFNEKYLDYAINIRESGEHLLDLISDILDMSKIEAGKHTLDLEKVNVNDVLRRAMNMVESRANEKNVTLRPPEFADQTIEIRADRRALMQIFLNLLANAVKFTPEYGSVWVEYKMRKDNVLFTVCDTGIGIPANKLAAVLRPFEQASSHYTREYEGTGLGLSITKELVELHGGTLSIESVVGKGTSVTFQLPSNGRTKI